MTRRLPAAGDPDAGGSLSIVRGGLALWAAVLLVAAACSGERAPRPEPPGGELALASRVLPEVEPARRFQVVREGQFRSAGTWSPAERLTAGQWQIRTGSWRAQADGGVRVDSGHRRVELELGTDAGSGRCAALGVRVDGLLASGWLELLEHDGALERQIAKSSARDAVAVPGHRPIHFLVPVASARPAQPGPRTLRFRGTGEELRIDRVDCLELAWSPGARTATDEEAWRIELDDEVRSGWLLGTGDRWTWEFDWQGADRVTLAVGQIVGSPAALQVALGPGSETRVVQTGGQWQSLQFERGARSGERATLELRLADDADAIVAVATLSLEATAPRSGPDGIVLISIDTLRADRMSLYGNSRRTTPAIDAWAARHAVIFDQAVAAAASTLPSHASMLTGLDVLDHGAVLGIPLGDEVVTIAERLSARGWRTGAVTGGGFLHPSYRLDQGFQQYRSWPRRPGFNPEELDAGIDAALRFLDAPSERPFFLFFHTYRVHYPYRGEEPFLSSWTGAPSSATVEILPATADPDWGRLLSSRSANLHDEAGVRPLPVEEMQIVVDHYDSGLAAMDQALARLLDRLESMNGRGARIAVLLTSDHGESLGELGFLGHGYLFDSNLRVPLLLALPGEQRPGRRIAGQVAGVDVAATVAALAGEAVDPALAGRSLVRDGVVARASDRSEAWSYSAEGRHGLSLRAGDRKLMLDDAVGEGLGPRARAFRLGVDVEESGLGTLPAAERERLALQARRYWSDAAGGNVLLLRAPPGRPWSGTLSGRELSAEWVRQFPAEDAGTLRPVGEDALGVQLEAGGRLPLRWWQPATASQLRVEATGATATGAAPRLVELDAAAACRGAVVAEPPTPGRLGIELRRRWRCSGEMPGAPDAAVLEELRALGYLQ